MKTLLTVGSSVCLLVLLGACSRQNIVVEPPSDSFTFTADDVARFRELVDEAADEQVVGLTGTQSQILVGTSAILRNEPLVIADPNKEPDVAIDLSQVPVHSRLRLGAEEASQSLYRVTNQFLNIRSEPRVTATAVGSLDGGDTLTVTDIVNAAWAKVQLADGQEGFVSLRYIAKLVPEERLNEEKAAYEGQYFVDFGFLNVRASPDTRAEQIGELPGQMIVEPLSLDDVWARILFEGREAYVAQEYLSPFQPSFLVRQDSYSVPIIRYEASVDGTADMLVQHIAALQENGFELITFTDFYNHLLEQEKRDVRLAPKTVIMTVSGIAPEELEGVESAFRASRARGTFFLATSTVGPGLITKSDIQTLVANGIDVQSQAHSGDDLRSLTNAQLTLELQQSRALLEDATGRTVNAISYPWGSVNDRVEQQAATAGYLFGVSGREDTRFKRAEFLQLPVFIAAPGLPANELVGALLPPVSGE